MEGGVTGEGVREETTNLLSALLIMLVRVKLASGSKKGARGGEGGREGGNICSLALTSAGEGLGTPCRAPVPRRGPGRGGGAGPREGAPGEIRGKSSPAAGRTPLSRSVKLNKEGIRVFLTSAGYN